jgi:hypothetical protein
MGGDLLELLQAKLNRQHAAKLDWGNDYIVVFFQVIAVHEGHDDFAMKSASPCRF